MCGLAGFVGGFDAESLEKASLAMAHRGPDGEGIWLDASRGVGLAHRRLSVLDLSESASQPMLSHCGRAVAVFNGEIYNFKELRRQLSNRGIHCRTQSDTEVLLALYIADGDAMLQSLNGMFAFAIWDRDNDTLLLARDRMGIKPLHYSVTTRGLAFASELNALTCLVDVADLDIEAVQRYITFLWCPGNQTVLKNIGRLGPGEALRLSREGTRKWQWSQRTEHSRPYRSSDTAAATETAAQLRSAVHRQMVSDVPVGAFLSGGLDSSAVVAFGREMERDIRCFTIAISGGQGDGFADDLPYARAVARHLEVPLEEVEVDSNRMAADIESMYQHLDEPIADPAALNVLYISRLAKRHGVKVLLSGAGGDDIFSGYRRHAAAAYDRYWTWLPTTLLQQMTVLSERMGVVNPGIRRLAKLMNGAHLPNDQRLANWFVWTKLDLTRSLLAPDVSAALEKASPLEPIVEFLSQLPKGLHDVERLLLLEQRFFLGDHNLIYTDRMSMAEGVEVRVPFLDNELVDFASGIPAALKQRGSQSKWILKKAMEPYLPRDVIYRPKTGFGAPLRNWMRGPLRELMLDTLSPQAIQRRGLFNSREVSALIGRNTRGDVDASYTLFSLMAIELWCRTSIDRKCVPA